MPMTANAKRLRLERRTSEKQRNLERWKRIQKAVRSRADSLGLAVTVTRNQALRVAGVLDIFPLSGRLCWLRSNHWEDLGQIDAVLSMAAALAGRPDASA